MDPISQSVWGAAFSSIAATKKNRELKIAIIIGLITGTLADLDVLIKSKLDPLLALEFHRHFTHSLLFIPVGALIGAILIKLLFFIFRKNKLPFTRIYLYSFLGYASHGLLDACTSYGTQLLWPINSVRYAWNIIAIVDPFFTLPILIILLKNYWYNDIKNKYFPILWGTLYLLFGLIQRERAERLTLEFAASRNHLEQVQFYDAKPSPLSLFVWKTTYKTKGDYYFVDAVNIGILGNITKYPGASIKAFSVDRDAPWIYKSTRQLKDLERFKWFSSGHIAIHPNYPNVVGDLRYSTIPNRIEPLWGIKLDQLNQSADRPTPFVSFRKTSKEDFLIFFRMLKGEP
jgi:inner membrane protein